jgi:glycosyltransferase involved in cell wall biosynthesis
MHIAYLLSGSHSESGGGGAESYVRTMADALIECGHRVTIMALGQREETNGSLRLKNIKSPNLHWYLYRALPIGKSVAMPVREVEWSRRCWSAVMDLHRREPIDIVETGETIVLQQLTGGTKPPVVVRGHGNQLAIKRFTHMREGWGDRFGRRLQVSGIRRASAIVPVSKFQAEEMSNELTIGSEKISVVPNPISPQLLQAAMACKRTEPRNPTILYTGRSELRKGTLELLQSVKTVAASFPNVKYVLAGARHNSIDDETLENVLGGNGTREHVQMAGHVAWQQLPDFYHRATVFVMPSYYETFGISVIEAMAFGLPVVASNVGGLPEVVEDGVTGLLVPPGDVKALADSLARLLHDPELRARMGRAGQERVRSEFTVDQIVPKMLAVYESVVRERANASVTRQLARSCAS